MIHPERAFSLDSTYVHLETNGSAMVEAVDADFWNKIGQRPYEGKRLVAVIQSDCDSGSWEMHPAGDELLYLLSGKIELILHEGVVCGSCNSVPSPRG